MIEHVWYAAYGSNLMKDRFLCYIEGGRPAGASRHYEGCTNKQPPEFDRPVVIHHKLYFSGSSPVWNDGGVAFIQAERDLDVVTMGRMYLITRQQFVEIFRQENGLKPDDRSLTPDIEDVVNNGMVIAGNSWYCRILLLGFVGEEPILTFTAPWRDSDIKLNCPDMSYVKTIIRGLKEIYNIPNEKILEYMYNADGLVPEC